MYMIDASVYDHCAPESSQSPKSRMFAPTSSASKSIGVSSPIYFVSSGLAFAYSLRPSSNEDGQEQPTMTFPAAGSGIGGEPHELLTAAQSW